MTTYEINPGENILHFDEKKLKPGDEVVFKTGYHDLSRWEKVFTQSGTADNQIVLRGEQGATLGRKNGIGEWIHTLGIKGHHYVIDGLTIVDSRQSGIFIRPEAKHVRIVNCHFERCGHGIWIEGSDVIVEDSSAAHGVMTVNEPKHPNNDFGASLAMIKNSRVTFRRCRAEHLLAPSYDYRFDGSMFEVFAEHNNVTDITIEDCDAYMVNTFMEIGALKSSPVQVGRITVRNSRIYAAYNGVIREGLTWNNFQWGTFHSEESGFAVNYLGHNTVGLELEVWNTQRSFPPVDKMSKAIAHDIDFKTGNLTAAEFFALRQQLPLPEPTPEPEPEPTPEPPTTPTPEVRYVIPAGGKIKLLFGEQVIELPFEIVEAS